MMNRPILTLLARAPWRAPTATLNGKACSALAVTLLHPPPSFINHWRDDGGHTVAMAAGYARRQHSATGRSQVGFLIANIKCITLKGFLLLQAHYRDNCHFFCKS